MDLHGNAALSWSGGRELARHVVEQGWTPTAAAEAAGVRVQGWTPTAAAEAAGVRVRCTRRWVGRCDRQLFDRSSAPHRIASRTDPTRVAAIAKLRRG